MMLPKELTTVTPLSKTVALVMFTLLPIVAFLLGMKYQAKLKDYKENIPSGGQKVCTQEAKLCPDGSSIGRTGPNCEFAPCPTSQTQVDESIPPDGQIACTQEANICPDGSTVSRTGSNCEFAPCPGEKPENGDNLFCGGIAGIACPEGYGCQYDGNYPDAGGTCLKNEIILK